MKGVIIKIILVFIVLYIIGIALIGLDGYYFTEKEQSIKTKYAIVYGNEVKENGEVSERLSESLDKVVELFNNKKVEKIIVSGGVGENGFDKAKIMKKYLMSKGIKFPRIIEDNKGNTIIESSKNAYRIILNRGDYPNIGVIGVNQFFHLSRIKLSLKKAGFVNISTVSSDYFEIRDFYSIIREVPAYIKYFFIINNDSIKIEDLELVGKIIIDNSKNY